jgi:hypothetical protein
MGLDHAMWKEMRSAPVTMNNFSVEDYEAVLGAYPAAYRKACRKDLDEALRLAEGDARARVEFLRDGFQYFISTLEATEKTLPLVRAGWKPASGLKGPAGIREAIRLWEERDRLIERHRENLVLSYMWVRSNDVTRTFNPLNRFRKAAPEPPVRSRSLARWRHGASCRPA